MIRQALTSIAAAALFAGLAAAQQHPGEERATDMAVGDVDAPIRMVEYASVACPHCAHWYENVWPMVQDEFISTGEMRFIYREMITGQPQIAYIGFAIADCGPDDQYFHALHLLFEMQSDIFDSVRNQQSPQPIYEQIGGALGLSSEDIDTCLNNPEVQEAVLARHQQAVDDGATGTPAFFINNQFLNTQATPDGLAYVYHVDGEPLILDGELVPSSHDADIFRRIILHLAEQSGVQSGN